MKLIEVEFLDHMSWESGNAETKKPEHIKAVGYLFKETASYLTLVNFALEDNSGMDDVDGYVVMKSTILRRRTLKAKPKPKPKPKPRPYRWRGKKAK